MSFFRAVEIDNIGTMGGGTNLPVVQAVCNKCHASYNDSFKCPSLALAKDMKAPASVEKSLPTRKDMEPYMKTCMSKMLAHVQGLQKPESEPDYAALRKHVEAAWKSGGFTPRELSKADVSY